MHESFREGFEKDAAWYHRVGNKVKGLFTGKEYIYHGTSAERAEGIAREGLRAHAVDAEHTIAGPLAQQDASRKDLIFTSRDPDVSKGYARQFTHGKKAREVLGASGIKVDLPIGSDRASLIRFAIPKSEYRKMSPRKNPVADLGAQGIEDMRPHMEKSVQDRLPKWLPGRGMLSRKAVDLVKHQQRSAHKHDVVFDNPISSKHIDKVTEVK